jgi:hypothetical protein
MRQRLPVFVEHDVYMVVKGIRIKDQFLET